jgi:hypothetical protein
MAADYVTTRRRRGAQEGAFRRRDPGVLSSLLSGAAAGFSEGLSVEEEWLNREERRLKKELDKRAGGAISEVSADTARADEEKELASQFLKSRRRGFSGRWGPQ